MFGSGLYNCRNFIIMEMNLLEKYHLGLKTIHIVIFSLFFQLGFIACTSGPKKNTSQNDGKSKIEKTESSGVALEPDAFWEAALDGDLEGVSSMLKLGMDANLADVEGRTALMFAAYNGHTEIAKILIGRGAKVDAVDHSHRTALLFAATGPFPETVKLLLDNKSNPNVVDNGEHFSPLMHAAAEGNLDIVKILLEYGADPDLKDVDGDTAESFAGQKGHAAVVDYLKSLK